MGRMRTLNIHSLQTRSPSLPVFSDSEGRVAALDLEAQALATGRAKEGEDRHRGKDRQLADISKWAAAHWGNSLDFLG